MDNEINKLFSGEKDKGHSERLINYLKGNMSPEERYQFEQEMNSDPFLSEAADGLNSMAGEELIPTQQEINKKLKAQLKKGRNRRKRAGIPGWILITIALLLLLLLAAWWVIHYLIN
jgi:hypothetical protein